MEVLVIGETGGNGDPAGDLQLPGQVGGQAKGFGIEEVAPTADRLAQGHRGHQHVQQVPEGQLAPAAIEDHRQGSADQGAMDGDATTPNGKRLQPIELVLAPLEQHVISAGSHHRRQHQDRQQVSDEGRIDAPALAQLAGEHQPQQHGQGNEQAIPTQGKGPQLKQQGPGGCKDGQGQGSGHQTPSKACTFSI